jgi:hypothetical protein
METKNLGINKFKSPAKLPCFESLLIYKILSNHNLKFQNLPKFESGKLHEMADFNDQEFPSTFLDPLVLPPFTDSDLERLAEDVGSSDG